MKNTVNSQNNINKKARVNNSDEYQDYIDKVCMAMMDGATFKDIHGIPEDTMQGIYAYAYDFYNQGRLDEAETFFRFLSVYDFYNADYIMGLAAVYHLKKKYEKAAELYTLAFILGKQDYRPLFHAGQCNLMMNKASAALSCFESVLESSNDDTLKSKTEIYISIIKENLIHKSEGK